MSQRNIRRAVLLVLATSLLTVGACTCGKEGKEGKAALQSEVARPAELQSEVAVRNPAALLEETLGLVRKFVALPVDSNMLIGFALQRARLPGGLASALDLQRPIWLVGLDGKKLGEETPSLVALPIRSKQACESALGVQMKRGGSDGELSVYVPQPTSPQLTKLKLWIDDKHLVLASSGKAFAVAKDYLQGKLLAQQPQHDLQAVVLRQDSSEAQIQQTLQQLKSAVSQKTGAAANPQLERAVSAVLLRYGELLTTSPRLEVSADLEGMDVTLSARANSAAGGDLARALKRQRTGTPFAMELLPTHTWAVFGGHDFPDDKQSSLLAGFLHQLVEVFPAEQKKQLLETFSAAAEHFGRSLTMALHRAADGGLGMLVLTRVEEPKQARAAVEQAAKLITEWADQQATAAGAQGQISAAKIPCGAESGQVYEVPLSGQPQPGSASLLPQLLGDSFGVGWVFARDVGVFALGRGVNTQLARSCTQLLAGGKSPAPKGLAGQETPFADTPAFKRALADPRTRSGVFYLSLVDLVRALEGRGFPALEPLFAAVRGKQVDRAISADWGVDSKRQAFTVNLQLPIGNLLLFKPFLDALGPGLGGGNPMPGLAPAVP